jgi:hypothetical protein
MHLTRAYLISTLENAVPTPVSDAMELGPQRLSSQMFEVVGRIPRCFTVFCTPVSMTGEKTTMPDVRNGQRMSSPFTKFRVYM